MGGTPPPRAAEEGHRGTGPWQDMPAFIGVDPWFFISRRGAEPRAFVVIKFTQ